MKILTIIGFIATNLFSHQLAAVSVEEMSAEHKRVIDEFVEQTGVLELFRQDVKAHYFELLAVPTLKQLEQSDFKDDPNPKVLMEAGIDDALEKAFKAPSLQFLHYQVFGKAYSKEEVEELLIFFKTDVGKKTLEKDSQLFEDWKKQRNKWAVSLRQNVKDAIDEKLTPYLEQQLAESAK